MAMQGTHMQFFLPNFHSYFYRSITRWHLGNGFYFTTQENYTNQTQPHNLCVNLFNILLHTRTLKVKPLFFPFLGTKQEIHVSAEEYVSELTDLNCLKFVVVAKVLETGKQYVDDCKLQLYNKDCIEVNVSRKSMHNISYRKLRHVSWQMLNHGSLRAVLVFQRKYHWDCTQAKTLGDDGGRICAFAFVTFVRLSHVSI